MPNTDARVPFPPPHAQPPRGVNHLVLNVRDLDVSHRFWTECAANRHSMWRRSPPQ